MNSRRLIDIVFLALLFVGSQTVTAALPQTEKTKSKTEKAGATQAKKSEKNVTDKAKKTLSHKEKAEAKTAKSTSEEMSEKAVKTKKTMRTSASSKVAEKTKAMKSEAEKHDMGEHPMKSAAQSTPPEVSKNVSKMTEKSTSTMDKSTSMPSTKIEKTPSKPALKENDDAVGKTTDGKTVYAGSRGGHYYLTDKGDKSYVKDFVGAHVVGATKDGRPIYEGPRGGHYYYAASGIKTYVPKDK